MKRPLIVVLIALVAAVAARVAAPAHQRQVRFSAALACGVERWSIKTLKDRPLLLPARATTVGHLTSLPRPSYLPPSRRLVAERRIYSVIEPYRRKQMADSRRVARICSRARVTGVAFFDFLHGQTGVAPNGIELHPTLGFACLV